MEVSAWLDIIGLAFLISISFICYKEGVLWPILVLCGSTVAHLLATSPRFQERFSVAFPSLIEAIPVYQVIPITIFLLTLFASHYFARYVGVKLEHSSLSLLGTINRLLGAGVGLILGITILAWGYYFVASHSSDMAVYFDGSSVMRWCVEEEQKFNLGSKIAGIVKTEVNRTREVVEQPPPENK